MKTINFNLRNVVAIAICFAAATMFSSCDKGGENNGNGNNNGNNGGDTENTVAAAFQQFCVDLEQVKPNVATPDNATNERNSKVSESVYTARAYYREKASDVISNEVAVSYKERVFNYIKSISADNKIYRVRTSINDPVEEVATFGDLQNFTGAYDDWSFKCSGKWVNAVTLHYGLGDEIGIDLIGLSIY